MIKILPSILFSLMLGCTMPVDEETQINNNDIDYSFYSTSTTGGSFCIPFSCEQLNKDCGLVNDGCGNLINCGFDPQNPDKCENEYERCGIGPALPNCSTDVGVSNVCDGGCVIANHPTLCASNKIPWFCAAPGYTPPKTGCVSFDYDYPTQGWCCPKPIIIFF